MSFTGSLSHELSGPCTHLCARPARLSAVCLFSGGAPGAPLAAGVSAALATLLVLCAALALGKLVHYVFFPAGKPPATIDEVGASLLPASAEHPSQVPSYTRQRRPRVCVTH